MKSAKLTACLKSFQQFIRLPLSFAHGGFTRPSSSRSVLMRDIGALYGIATGRAGFTLIEILVVVLIIGILGAIMLPQYQRAVLKSRFAALMPIAKSMADSNEAYYLEYGEYADNAEDLPIQGRRNYSDGTELEFGTSTDYAYVLASNPSVEHNTYVVYQKHSKNFADTTQCEALTADEKANQVCQSFGGTPLDGSLSGADYTAYLLSGNGNGTFEKECIEPLVTEKECPSGCGVMTRESAACNTSTGKWDPDDGFDEEDCPKPLGTQTQNCPAGYTGTKTRQGNVCQDGTYTWGSWNDTCQVDPCYGASTCNNGVATACQNGFYLKDNKCKACGEGYVSCTYYEGSNGATGFREVTCKSGYYKRNEGSNSFPNYYCKKCGKNVITCGDRTGSPTQCVDGYYNGYGDGSSCLTPCIDNAPTCKPNNGQPTSCRSGYCLRNISGGNRCIAC